MPTVDCGYNPPRKSTPKPPEEIDCGFNPTAAPRVAVAAHNEQLEMQNELSVASCQLPVADPIADNAEARALPAAHATASDTRSPRRK